MAAAMSQPVVVLVEWDLTGSWGSCGEGARPENGS
jgi:hypothetical protein